MIRYENRITVSRPIERAYDYMTPPGNWAEHLPCTIHVEPAHREVPAVGEKVRETLNVFGIRMEIDWVIVRDDRPTHFAIEGTAEAFGGSRSRLTYDFSEKDEKTLVERRITCEQKSLVMRLLEPISKFYFIYEGKEALKRAREILEEGEGCD